MADLLNVDRRIKKHIHGKPQRIRIGCVAGLENVAQTELRLLLAAINPAPDLQVDIQQGEGELVIKNIPYHDVQFLIPRLRSASDVFLFVTKKRCLTPTEMTSALEKIIWPMYLGSSVRIRARSFKSKIFHEALIKEGVRQVLANNGIAIVDDGDAPLLDILLRRDVLHVEIGLAGRPLYQRDYKAQHVAIAPLKAHAAYSCIAAFYAWLARRNETKVMIPFAGSGTLGFEAVLYLCDVYPGLWRTAYGVQRLPFFKSEAWNHYRPRIPETLTPITLQFIENDPRQSAALLENCRSFFAPLGNHVLWSVHPGDALKISSGSDQVVFMNPPYGERLSAAPGFFDALQGWVESQAFAGFCLTGKGGALELESNGLKKDNLEFQTGGRFTNVSMWHR